MKTINRLTGGFPSAVIAAMVLSVMVLTAANANGAETTIQVNFEGGSANNPAGWNYVEWGGNTLNWTDGTALADDGGTTTDIGMTLVNNWASWGVSVGPSSQYTAANGTVFPAAVVDGCAMQRANLQVKLTSPTPYTVEITFVSAVAVTDQWPIHFNLGGTWTSANYYGPATDYVGGDTVTLGADGTGTVTYDMQPDGSGGYELVFQHAPNAAIGGGKYANAVNAFVIVASAPSPPTITSLDPSDEATVETPVSLTATFSENIATNTSGSITITNTAENTVLTTIPIGDSSQITVNTTNLTITPTQALSNNTDYAVLISTDAITNAAGLFFAGITNATTWNFSTVTRGLPILNTGGGATELGVTNATLRGQVTANTPATAFICWEAGPGGNTSSIGDTGSWDNVSAAINVTDSTVFSNAVADLYYGVEYSYRTYASNVNGAGWSDLATFTTAPPQAYTGRNALNFAWYDGVGDSGLTDIDDGVANGENGGLFALTPTDESSWPVSLQGKSDWTDEVWQGGNLSDTYSQMWWGYFRPPLSGTYTIYAHGDDFEMTWLDVDQDGDFEAGTEDITRNVSPEGWPSPKTETVDLVAGEYYAVAFAHTENTGGDFFNLEITKPGGSAERVNPSITGQDGWWYQDVGGMSNGVENESATNVTSSTADLLGTLDATQAVFTVSVYWSTSNNTGSAEWLADGTASNAVVGTYTNVTGQPLSASVSNLLSNTAHTFTFVAMNAATNIWASPSKPFKTKAGEGQIAIDNVAADSVTPTSARLNAILQTPGTNADVIATWWKAGDTTTNEAPVDSWNDVVSTNIGYTADSLDPDTAYSFTFRATNATDDAWAAGPLSFTTLDSVPPTLIAISPTDGATNVLPGAALVATFDEPIALMDGGTITITDLSDGSSTRVIALTNAMVTTADETNVVIDLDVALDLGTAYSVRISPDAIADQAPPATAFAGIEDDTTWNFTTFARPRLGEILLMDTGYYSQGYNSGRPAGARYLLSSADLGGFDAAGADKLVLALSGEKLNSFEEISYGGVVMTQIVVAADFRRVAMFCLDSPQKGGDLVVDFGGGNGVGLSVMALVGTRPGFVSPPSSATTTFTTLATTNDGAWVVAAAVNNNSGGCPPQAPLIPVYSGEAGSSGHGSGYQEVAQSGTTITPTFPTAEAVVAIEFPPVPAFHGILLIVR